MFNSCFKKMKIEKLNVLKKIFENLVKVFNI